jgi:glycosyltransferase involved in cell wall biosynthesis
MNYLLAVQTPAFPIEMGRFAIESAFAIHLKVLLNRLGHRFDRIVLVAPPMQTCDYQRSKANLTELAASDDRIVLVPLPEFGMSVTSFWRNAAPLWRKLRKLVRESSFVHTGLSSDSYRPALLILNLAAWIECKPIAFYIDIDFRHVSSRYYKLGSWSRKSYFINRVFHDRFKLAQVRWAIRKCDLVLLKSKSMVADLGRRHQHVKFFLDAAHGKDDVISGEQLIRRRSRFDDDNRDLQIIYFGRLVPYKGCDFMLEAVARARERGARIALTLVGDGEVLPVLKDQVGRLGINGSVTFLPAVSYGPQLFDLVDRADIAIASPRVEDTPRAALDAMARGLPILAFDIDYYKTLAEASGAVVLASWPEIESLAEQLRNLDGDRSGIREMVGKAVAFARDNSQDIWLERRIEWTLEALACHACVSS